MTDEQKNKPITLGAFQALARRIRQKWVAAEASVNAKTVEAKGYAESAKADAELSKRYYIPSVDEFGNLNWTPTKSDMTSPIPSVNIYGDKIDELTNAMNSLSDNVSAKVGYAEYSQTDYKIHLYDEEGGTEVCDPIGPIVGGTGTGGGGGGTVTASVVEITNRTGWNTTTVAQGKDCILTFDWSSTRKEEPTGNGTLTVRVNGSAVLTKDIAQGRQTVNVKDYLTLGSNNVKLTVEDSYGVTDSLIFRNISCQSLGLYSTFDDAKFYTDSTVQFTYTAESTLEKTMYFKVDGGTPSTLKLTSSRIQSRLITGLTHGVHTLEVWYTVKFDGVDVESNTRLRYNIIRVESGNTTPIISVRFYESSIKQYYTYNISYILWTPAATASITLSDGTKSETKTVDRTDKNIWAYRKDETGSVTLTFTSGATTVSLPLTVTDSGIVLNEATTMMALKLSSKGHQQGEATAWSYGTVNCQFSGMTPSCGWKLDDDGIPVMRLKDTGRMTIPLKPFEENHQYGMAFEVEFATRDVFDYETEILKCLSDGIGIRMTAQEMLLKWGNTDKTQLLTQYKDDEHVRISFVITHRDRSNYDSNLVYVYINGIMSGVIGYGDASFQQTTPSVITLGSSDCTLDLYSIRVYYTEVDRFGILNNWLADMQDGAQLLEEYTRNSIYENDAVNPDLLPDDLPYFVVTSATLPESKTDEITVSGYFKDRLNASRSFSFTGATMKIQGTSSVEYPRKNYKIKFGEGFIMDSGSTVAKYSVNGGIPTKTFTFKADYASSEGCNNVELVDLYDKICPYRTPVQREKVGGEANAIYDSRYRQGIAGFPIVIFQNKGDGDLVFIGKYNFNNDKGTAEVYGLNASEDVESWETSNNTSLRVRWKSADFTSLDNKGNPDWQNDYEARYPENNTNATRLAALTAWVASTDTTVEGLTPSQKSARLQKFKDEFSDWFNKEDAIFYYLFTELFLMVDSRAKNAFPTRWSEDGVWSWLPYDMDTALGINNEGLLTYGYKLEDIDKVGSKDVFNAQDSVLWNNIRQCFWADLKTAYAKMRSAVDAGGSRLLEYSAVEKKFEEHQNHWPVAIWNEDAHYKYVVPKTEDHADRLHMCQGAKLQQRQWWMYNRFRYIDSKYGAGDALTKRIAFRSYSSGSFTIVPYADIYVRVLMGSYEDYVRAERLQEYTLTLQGVEGANDTETYIYSADQLKSVGDLSVFNPGYINISDAVKLQELKIGDVNKTNGELDNMETLTLGNNTLLRKIDARNCFNLSNEINAENCASLEEAYFDGTGIPSIKLPSGGVLKKLHLPSTMEFVKIVDQPSLSDFTIEGYSSIDRLWIDTPSTVVASKVLDMVDGMKADGSIRLLGLSIEAGSGSDITTFLSNFSGKNGLDEYGEKLMGQPQVGGTIHVGTVTYAEKTAMDGMLEDWPSLTVNADHVICTVRWLNWDGTVLKTAEVEQGSMAVYDGANPTREMSVSTVYTFSGWNHTGAVTSDTYVTALFDEETRSYTITFSDEDGTVLEQKSVAYGTVPSYTGTTPTKGMTAQYTYAFNGWDTAVAAVSGDKTYKAQYLATVRTYTITFIVDGVQTTKDVAYGDTPSYGTNPKKRGWKFTGWTPTVTSVTGPATYTAEWVECPEVEVSGTWVFKNTIDTSEERTIEVDFTSNGTTYEEISVK